MVITTCLIGTQHEGDYTKKNQSSLLVVLLVKAFLGDHSIYMWPKREELKQPIRHGDSK